MRKHRKAPGANGGQRRTDYSRQVYAAQDVLAQKELAAIVADHESALRASATAVADLIRQRLQADDRPRPLRLGSIRTGPFTLHVADGRVFCPTSTRNVHGRQLEMCI